MSSQQEEQPADTTEPHCLLAQFRTTMESFLYQWRKGFVLVRTSYLPDATADTQLWDQALATLHARARVPSTAGADAEAIPLPVIADRDVLNGADYDTVRNAFKAWVADFGGSEDEWQSGIRRECFVVVDQDALESVVGTCTEGDTTRKASPWIVVVDAVDPATVPYNGGGPYLGWMRVPVADLWEFGRDLDAMSMEEMCPTRRFDGQIPFYDGSPKGKLLPPPGGLEGRYKFPAGTPRGREAGRAMLEEIHRAIGGGRSTE